MKFVVIQSVHTIDRNIDATFGLFHSIIAAESWIAAQQYPKDYYVLPLTIKN